MSEQWSECMTEDCRNMVEWGSGFCKAHNRIAELEQEAQDGFDQLAVSQREVAELEETNRAYKEAWSVNILTNRIAELEAKLDAVLKCQRYTISVVNDEHYGYTTDNPDGEWMKADEVLKALQQEKGDE